MNCAEVLDLLRRADGQPWQLVRRTAGGEVGAYVVDSPSGRRILKWYEDPSLGPRFERTHRLLSSLHADGYPLPRYDPPRPFPGGIALTQEPVPEGAVIDRVTHSLLLDVLAVNDRQADAALHEISEWPSFLRQTLRTGADGWCLHEPLRQHSANTAAVLGRIEDIGATFDDRDVVTGDVMHIDFHHRNLLQRRDRLVSVIDWEGAVPGDRNLDLVTFATGLAVAETEPGVEGAAWSVIEKRCVPAVLSAYVAHMVLRRLDWSIRFHPGEVDLWLRRGEELLARYS